MSKEKQRQLNEIYRSASEELFNALERQYQEVAKVKSESEQIEEMAQAIFDSGVVIDGLDRAFRSVARKDLPDSRFLKMAAYLHDAGYRKRSEGEWILTQEKRLFGDKYYTCSNCQSRNPTMIKFNYCFNCGAKMKGGADGGGEQ